MKKKVYVDRKRSTGQIVQFLKPCVHPDLNLIGTQDIDVDEVNAEPKIAKMEAVLNSWNNSRAMDGGILFDKFKLEFIFDEGKTLPFDDLAFGKRVRVTIEEIK